MPGNSKFDFISSHWLDFFKGLKFFDRPIIVNRFVQLFVDVRADMQIEPVLLRAFDHHRRLQLDALVRSLGVVFDRVETFLIRF